MIVNGAAVLRSSTTPLAGQTGSLMARMVKYIANSAAKNISSLDSQMMVPTLTMLGLVSEWIRLWSKVVEAAVTRSLLPPRRAPPRRGGDQAACRHTSGDPGPGRPLGTAEAGGHI